MAISTRSSGWRWEVRERLLRQLEGVVGDIEKVLALSRKQEGQPAKCKACGSFIPGTSRLNLKDLLMLLRELKGALPTQIEQEGRYEIGVTVVGGVQIVPNLPAS